MLQICLRMVELVFLWWIPELTTLISQLQNWCHLLLNEERRGLNKEGHRKEKAPWFLGVVVIGLQRAVQGISCNYFSICLVSFMFSFPKWTSASASSNIQLLQVKQLCLTVPFHPRPRNNRVRWGWIVTSEPVNQNKPFLTPVIPPFRNRIWEPLRSVCEGTQKTPKGCSHFSEAHRPSKQAYFSLKKDKSRKVIALLFWAVQSPFIPQGIPPQTTSSSWVGEGNKKQARRGKSQISP